MHQSRKLHSKYMHEVYQVGLTKNWLYFHSFSLWECGRNKYVFLTPSKFPGAGPMFDRASFWSCQHSKIQRWSAAGPLHIFLFSLRLQKLISNSQSLPPTYLLTRYSRWWPKGEELLKSNQKDDGRFPNKSNLFHKTRSVIFFILLNFSTRGRFKISNFIFACCGPQKK